VGVATASGCGPEMTFACLPKVFLLLQLSDSRYFTLVTYGYDGAKEAEGAERWANCQTGDEDEDAAHLGKLACTLYLILPHVYIKATTAGETTCSIQFLQYGDGSARRVSSFSSTSGPGPSWKWVLGRSLSGTTYIYSWATGAVDATRSQPKGGWVFGILIKLLHCQLKIDTFRVIYDDGRTAMMANDSKTSKLFQRVGDRKVTGGT